MGKKKKCGYKNRYSADAIMLKKLKSQCEAEAALLFVVVVVSGGVNRKRQILYYDLINSPFCFVITKQKI